jgi:hypothetical protein
MLQGRVAGINVMQQAGTVGTASNIRIRGASSLSANYNPVVYVDGIPAVNARYPLSPKP